MCRLIGGHVTHPVKDRSDELDWLALSGNEFFPRMNGTRVYWITRAYFRRLNERRQRECGRAWLDGYEWLGEGRSQWETSMRMAESIWGDFRRWTETAREDTVSPSGTCPVPQKKKTYSLLQLSPPVATTPTSANTIANTTTFSMPTSTRPRALSVAEPPSKKKLKTSHDSNDDDLANCFASGVLDPESVNHFNESYRSSGPFLHAVIDKLFKDDLISKAKDECIGELSFTEKETDIYKVCTYTHRSIAVRSFWRVCIGAPDWRFSIIVIPCRSTNRSVAQPSETAWCCEWATWNRS